MPLPFASGRDLHAVTYEIHCSLVCLRQRYAYDVAPPLPGRAALVDEAGRFEVVDSPYHCIPLQCGFEVGLCVVIAALWVHVDDTVAAVFRDELVRRLGDACPYDVF